MQLNQLIQIFNDSIGKEFGTILVGGFNEPCYYPCRNITLDDVNLSSSDCLSSNQVKSDLQVKAAEIQFTKDYIRSALHEIAHWCIAGDERRKVVDYGYWYRPDGRNELEQEEFFRVEVKPQAIEKIFSEVCRVEFRVSCDNLGGLVVDEKSFEYEVDRQIQSYRKQGLPKRAQMFIDALIRNEF